MIQGDILYICIWTCSPCVDMFACVDPSNGYTYTLDAEQRVKSLTGPVTTVTDRDNYEEQCLKLCCAMWYLEKRTIYEAGEYNVGHIVGANLNGDPDNLLNYFPHYFASNQNPGTWFRMERVAASVGNYFNTIVKDGCEGALHIDITFGYSNRDFPVVIPDDGTYTLRTSDACFTKLLAIYPSGSCVMVDSFTKATQPGGAGTDRVFTMPWVNHKADPYDAHKDLKKDPNAPAKVRSGKIKKKRKRKALFCTKKKK